VGSVQSLPYAPFAFDEGGGRRGCVWREAGDELDECVQSSEGDPEGQKLHQNGCDGWQEWDSEQSLWIGIYLLLSLLQLEPQMYRGQKMDTEKQKTHAH